MVATSSRLGLNSTMSGFLPRCKGLAKFKATSMDTAEVASVLTAPALARSAGAMTFLKFAGKQLFKPEMSPFTIGGIVAFLALGSLSLSSDKAAREASPFVTPKKHH